jgi:hypothetical protein
MADSFVGSFCCYTNSRDTTLVGGRRLDRDGLGPLIVSAARTPTPSGESHVK